MAAEQEEKDIKSCVRERQEEDEIKSCIRERGESLRQHLDENNKLRNLMGKGADPVRAKHLEEICAHLHAILLCLDSTNNAQPDREEQKSLRFLLEQIKTPEKISRENAWELASLFEIELINLTGEPHLHVLLKAHQHRADNKDIRTWDKHFRDDDLESVLQRYENRSSDEPHNDKVRRFLMYLRNAHLEEYRKDLAKIRLRGRYLVYMTIVLTAALSVFSGAYIFYTYYNEGLDPRSSIPLLLLVLAAGAVGSVLSRARRLGRQPLLRTGIENGDADPPLGVRALISEGTIFIAQPLIGATAALIVFLIYTSGLVTIQGLPQGAPTYGVIAFLAGFSEPFFLATIDKVAARDGESGERSSRTSADG